ncbi:MAG TPA: metallophosphoesterase [Candidatus Eisenbacteria bacterium]|nr:metallophosphoesterase [Candidatus Eisenbacteria bacterium]
MLDTGDIVESGSHSDQFRALADILAKAGSLPYLVGVGNHELDNNRPGRARVNTAAFLKPIDPSLGPDRLYYKRTIGRVRFLFLDSNDFAYESGPVGRIRREAQLAWLVEELRAVPDEPGWPTIVVMHHPILQSSEKHRGQARSIWAMEYKGRSFPDILADGGVDLVLAGHTHTFERFRATRRDGKGFHLVNLSGRPLSAFLWFGDGQRRARAIPEGGEIPWFLSRGWTGLSGWDLTQEEAMLENEADQFARFRVEPDGGLTMSVRFMNRPDFAPPVRLLWGEANSLELERKK